MRPIDADKLKQDLLDKSFYPAIVARAIDNVPTVNPYEWISVEDRLPEDMQEVLCYKGKFWGNLQDVYTYLGDGKWQDDYGNIADTKDEAITHWTPLPAPPTEKEN